MGDAMTPRSKALLAQRLTVTHSLRARESADGLNDAHVANAIFEIGMRTDAALRFDRGEKIFFHAPFGFQFRRKLDNVQRTIANLTRLHYIRTEIVSERAGCCRKFPPGRSAPAHRSR